MREAKAYNPPLLFLVGLLAFCLGILNGIFAVLDKVDKGPAKSLGYVLIWISISALVAVLSAIVLQIKKAKSPEQAPQKPTEGAALETYKKDMKASDRLIFWCMVAPVVPGFFVVVACVRLGIAIANPTNVITIIKGGP